MATQRSVLFVYYFIMGILSGLFMGLLMEGFDNITSTTQTLLNIILIGMDAATVAFTMRTYRWLPIAFLIFCSTVSSIVAMSLVIDIAQISVIDVTRGGLICTIICNGVIASLLCLEACFENLGSVEPTAPIELNTVNVF